jgi:REP-associated tyrosine transposase
VPSGGERVARTAEFAVRGSSLATIPTVSYSTAVSKLRRPFLSNRYFFVTVRLLARRTKLADSDYLLLARAFNRARAAHHFYLTAWVFLADHWHGICAPVYPANISLVMKAVKTSSMAAINRRRGTTGEVWQARFFDRALRTVREYNEKVEYIHLNPVKAGLVRRASDWRWSSVNEYSGMSAAEQRRRCGLTIDRIRIPADPKTRI